MAEFCSFGSSSRAGWRKLSEGMTHQLPWPRNDFAEICFLLRDSYQEEGPLWEPGGLLQIETQEGNSLCKLLPNEPGGIKKETLRAPSKRKT